MPAVTVNKFASTIYWRAPVLTHRSACPGLAFRKKVLTLEVVVCEQIRASGDIGRIIMIGGCLATSKIKQYLRMYTILSIQAHNFWPDEPCELFQTHKFLLVYVKIGSESKSWCILLGYFSQGQVRNAEHE